MYFFLNKFFFVVMLCFASLSQAQLEDYFTETEQKSSSADRRSEVSSKEEPLEEDDEVDVELRELEKFKDIAVIQKKYLSKTQRFELWGAGALGLNSQFHNFFGLNAALTYHFNERWGLEVEGLFVTDAEKSITENLDKKQFIQTRSIVVPESYYGLHLRWSPVYGKMSLRERTINPFEVYFSFGGGITGTDDGQSAFTFHGGMGQVYPTSKNTTFRWALGYNFFQADAKQDLNNLSTRGQQVDTSFFYLSVGMSIYFPFSEER